MYQFQSPPGFDDLPDNHPLKKFFKEFRGDGNQMPGKRGGRDGGRDGGTRPVAQGSGFFISEDGYLVTNNHVVDGGQTFTVVTDDGKELDAKLVGADPKTDLAVLKVDGGGTKFTYVNFADDSKIRVGDWVVAVGNPFGLGGTVTAGIISARGRDIGAGPYDDFIQIDAAVNHGNSGGPAFNLNGEVVGINTAIFSPSGGNVGIAFAIPASTAQDVVKDLMTSGTVDRGWLGVQIQPVDKDIADSLGLTGTKGALVSEAQDNSPGKAAGIKAGDVIVAVDGKTVDGPRELAKIIGNTAPGKDVEVTLWRDGKSEAVKLTLGELPATDKQASADQPAPDKSSSLKDFGLTVTTADDGKGLVVTDVDPDGAGCRPRHPGRRRHRLGQLEGRDRHCRLREGHRRSGQDRPQGGARPGGPRRRQPLRRAARRQGLIHPDSDASATHPRGRKHRIAKEPALLSVSVPVPAAAGPITCCRNHLPT